MRPEHSVRQRLSAHAGVAPPAPGAFQKEFDLQIDEGANAMVAVFAIPDGMTLDIESISTYATAPTGQTPRLSITTTVKGDDATYFLPLAKQETVDRADWLCGTQPLRLYADSRRVLLLITRTQTVGNANFSISISGNLTLTATP